ncbi:hypothetical protein Patl1_32872 [Pistacia atlantica]|uniref:Uncharacterized protein n=1 Tax=Pistacia atlantica TaxID=434234 RepID=A0ACC1AQF3_9ROSI|nr:hypothetical protein Patl1_32872 [Pistacia atlantica]
MIRLRLGYLCRSGFFLVVTKFDLESLRSFFSCYDDFFVGDCSGVAVLLFAVAVLAICRFGLEWSNYCEVLGCKESVCSRVLVVLELQFCYLQIWAIFLSSYFAVYARKPQIEVSMQVVLPCKLEVLGGL